MTTALTQRGNRRPTASFVNLASGSPEHPTGTPFFAASRATPTLASKVGDVVLGDRSHLVTCDVALHSGLGQFLMEAGMSSSSSAAERDLGTVERVENLAAAIKIPSSLRDSKPMSCCLLQQFMFGYQLHCLGL
jgi:hypothetical protein